MWRGIPPHQESPFSWPGERAQVVDSTRRGDEVDQFVDRTLLGRNPLILLTTEVPNGDSALPVHPQRGEKYTRI